MQTLLVLFLVSFFVYLILDFVPGDPVYALLGENVTPERYEAVYLELGLDKPFVVRYFSWLLDALRGDFGMSYRYSMPVSEMLHERVWITLYLSALALVISSVLGVLAGIFSAVRRGRPSDNVITVLANISSCLPQFWIAIMLILLFSNKLNIFQSGGFAWPWEDMHASLKTTVMPVVTLSLGSLAMITRQTRSGMLEVIRQDYVRTARSKGLSESTVIGNHALKNALIPVLTTLGMRFGVIIGSCTFVEQVFSIPGLGAVIVNSAFNRDFCVVQAGVLISSAILCLTNLVIDLLYAVVDPRIRID